MQEVYDFASDPANLAKWASGLGSIRKSGKDWISDSPMGKIKIEFAKKNKFGVLDHDVTLESGEMFHNPMRVVPNGSGSEVTFTLIRQSGMSDKSFMEDAKTVEKDLGILKSLLEEEKERMKKLEKEGFTDVRVCPIEAGMDSGEHTHDEHTVHVILSGELTITGKNGTKTFRPGDRVEFPKGTRHSAKGGPSKGRMIVGVKSGGLMRSRIKRNPR